MEENLRGRIEEELLSLLAERGADKSACPSEVARRVDAENWRERMDAVREVARSLARRGRARVTQGERTLGVDEPYRGAIRLRRGER